MTPGNNVDPLPLLSERDVAHITGLSLASVRRWRLVGQGPRYLKLGRAVRYQREDLAAWLKSRPGGGEVAKSPERSVPPESRPGSHRPLPN
jgi:predicted DNA-binding transcriptional regulator AlpA